jgi:hypothetical protein
MLCRVRVGVEIDQVGTSQSTKVKEKGKKVAKKDDGDGDDDADDDDADDDDAKLSTLTR